MKWSSTCGMAAVCALLFGGFAVAAEPPGSDFPLIDAAWIANPESQSESYSLTSLFDHGPAAPSEEDCIDWFTEPVTSFPPLSLQEALGVDDPEWFISGHIQQGASTNNRNPLNPPGGFGNSPAGGLIFRSDEYQFNQLYLSVGKKADTSQSAFDYGGQIDLVYGTDYAFMGSLGLENELDGSNRWNGATGSGYLGKQLHGLALPQMFAEFAYEDLSVQIGHFYNVFGHEQLLPTENFYYTSSYALFFNGSGESAPILGVLASWQVTPQLLIAAGFHRGQIRWEDNNDDLNLMGMVEWATVDRDWILTYSFDIGAEDDAGENTIFAQSVIAEWQYAETASYVLNSSYGFEENVATGGGTAQWYGFANYFAFELSEQLIAGVRYELFHDVDGTRVFPRPGHPANAPGMYHALTMGFNILPHSSLTIRPEVRWDKFIADGTVPPGPFGNNTARSQFMAAIDLLITF